MAPAAAAQPRPFLKDVVILLLLCMLGGTWALGPGQNAGAQSGPAVRASGGGQAAARDSARRAFLAMEAANRGFLLTGEAQYRATFNAERDRFSASYNKLLRLSEGQDAEQERLREIKAKFTRWFKLYNPMIEGRRSAGTYVPDLQSLEQCRLLHEEILAELSDIAR